VVHGHVQCPRCVWAPLKYIASGVVRRHYVCYVINVVIAHRVAVCFNFADMCGDASSGTGLDCGYDRGVYFSVGCCCMVWRLRMYLWQSLRGQTLYGRRAGWPSLNLRSLAANWALFMVCVAGVEVTRVLMEVREDGWVAAAPRGSEPPFLEPSV
jgi:hypothetical protein